MMRRIFSPQIFLFLFCAFCWIPGVHAVEPSEVLKDPALESRARDISTGLRCLVCQNQSIDDSEAPLAKDLRILVRQRLQSGDSDADVKRYLVDRYGNFILLKPPFELTTALLWLSPFFALGFGVFLVWGAARLRSGAAAAPLSQEEQAELARLLTGGASVKKNGEMNKSADATTDKR